MFEIEKPKAWYSSPWFIITIIVIIIVAVVVGSYFLLKGGPGALPKQEELDFTISGVEPEVCYIPFRTGADERWKLTIECLEMPSELAWTTILLYNEYWDKGAGHKCDVEYLYPLATELTQLQKIGVDPNVQEKYPLHAEYENTVYTGIYGTSTPQSFTVFFSFPWDGTGRFHVMLENVEEGEEEENGEEEGDATIYIDGNDDFTPANGVTSGSGTVGDPYIIEDWDISARNGNGIEIRNTTAHFIVRNCYVHDGLNNGNSGIYFDNVINGKIDNNLVVNNDDGIVLYSSDNNTLTINTCRNNDDGIRLYSSDNNLVLNNTCKSNDDGIVLYSSSNNNLTNNTCGGNRRNGIGLYDYSSNNNISHNTCWRNNGNGITSQFSDNNIIYHNTCEYNGGTGIRISESSSNGTISNNTCSSNHDGIVLHHNSNYNTLDNNTCKKNRWDGIALAGDSLGNTIYHNTCENNDDYGILLNSIKNTIYHNNFVYNVTQAYDYRNNYWDNGYPSGGNYWSDYTGSDANGDGIGDTPYYILGSILGDNNQDRYPLMNPV